MPEEFRYWAFISYNHHDRRWARWLHRRLETYRVPRHLVGRAHRDGAIPRRLMPMFRDRDELPSSPSLNASIQQALRESRYLIVICSPHAAGSRWVNDEIEAFKALGRADRILCWRIERSLRRGDCFPPALLRDATTSTPAAEPPAEPLAADIISDGRDASVLKLLAGMLGIGYDELRRREYRRRIQQKILLAIAIVAAISLLVSIWRWQQDEKHRALDAQALQSRIALLYRNGRQELLAHNEARAAVYLGAAYRLGLDTPALRYLLARAMPMVDAQHLRIETGSPVWLVDISHDGSQVLAINDDRHLRAYDAHSGTRLFDIDAGEMRDFFAAYSPQGTMIWLDSNHAAEPLRRLRLFDARNGHLLAQVAVDPDASNVSPPPIDDADRRFAYVAPDRSVVVVDRDGSRQRLAGVYSVTRFCQGTSLLIAGRSDGVAELHDVSRRGMPLVHRFAGLGSTPTLVDSSLGCAMIAEGTENGAVRVWDARSSAVLMSSGHKQPIIELRFSPTGERLMTMTRTGVGVWDGHSGALIYANRFLGPSGNLAAMRPDGRVIARLLNGRLTLIDIDTSAELYSLDGHSGGASVFSFAGDGAHIVSGGGDGAIIVWQQPQRLLREYSRQPVKGESPSSGGPLVFSHDGHSYFAASPQAAIYSSDVLQPLTPLPSVIGSVELADFSADDRLLAIATAAGGVGLWDTATGKSVRTWPSFQERPLSIEFDGSGHYLAEAIIGQTTRILDVESGAQLRLIRREYPHALALSRQQPLVAVGNKGIVSLSEIATGKLLWSVRLPSQGSELQPITVVAFSPDGQSVLVTSRREHAYLLDVQNGSVRAELRESASVFFGSAAFSADSRSVVIADGNNSALLWKLDDRRHLVLGGHTAAVRAVAFSSDGALVVSVGADGVAKIWDAGNGELLDSFTAHDGQAQWDFAGFSPDHRYLVTGGGDGHTRLWAVVRESRDADTIARVLACRAPWTLEGSALRSSAVDAQNCLPAASGSQTAVPGN